MATVLGLFHVLFGTLVLSSLLFIGVIDVTGVIAHYIASTLIRRGIVIFEISGLRKDVPQEGEQVSPPQVVACDESDLRNAIHRQEEQFASTRALGTSRGREHGEVER